MKTILLDLDGVLNTYNGKYEENIIPPLKTGAEEFLQQLAAEYIVVIFSTRKKELVELWLKENNLDKYINRVTNTKVPAFVHIDDRCIVFNGNYQDTIEKIKFFKPYWKK